MSSTTVALPSSHSRPLPHTPQAFLPPGANTHGVTTSNMTEIQNFSYLPARKQDSLFSCLTTTLHILCARRESLASHMLQLKRSNLFNESIKFGDNCWRAGAIAPAVEKALVQRVACTSALTAPPTKSKPLLSQLLTHMCRYIYSEHATCTAERGDEIHSIGRRHLLRAFVYRQPPRCPQHATPTPPPSHSPPPPAPPRPVPPPSSTQSTPTCVTPAEITPPALPGQVGARMGQMVDMDAYRRQDYEAICTCGVVAGCFSDQCKHVLRVLLDCNMTWDSYLKPWSNVKEWEMQVYRSPNLPASHAKL